MEFDRGKAKRVHFIVERIEQMSAIEPQRIRDGDTASTTNPQMLWRCIIDSERISWAPERWSEATVTEAIKAADLVAQMGGSRAPAVILAAERPAEYKLHVPDSGRTWLVDYDAIGNIPPVMLELGDVLLCTRAGQPGSMVVQVTGPHGNAWRLERVEIKRRRRRWQN